MTVTAVNYAKVLYNLGISPETVQDTEKIFREVPELKKTLSNPLIPFSVKSRVIGRTIPGPMQNFVRIVVQHHKMEYLDEIFASWKQLCREKENVLHAILKYVTPPKEEQLKGIQAFLKKEFGPEDVEIEMFQDLSLIGGFILDAGGQEYDWSLKGRYDKLRYQLTRR